MEFEISAEWRSNETPLQSLTWKKENRELTQKFCKLNAKERRFGQWTISWDLQRKSEFDLEDFQEKFRWKYNQTWNTSKKLQKKGELDLVWIILGEAKRKGRTGFRAVLCKKIKKRKKVEQVRRVVVPLKREGKFWACLLCAVALQWQSWTSKRKKQSVSGASRARHRILVRSYSCTPNFFSSLLHYSGSPYGGHFLIRHCTIGLFFRLTHLLFAIWSVIRNSISALSIIHFLFKLNAALLRDSVSYNATVVMEDTMIKPWP